MIINYLGHSCFKLKGKQGTVINDPFEDYIGFQMPVTSADIVTVSHSHKDHNNISKVRGTTRRPNPFIIDAPGEYEVGGVSVFGVTSFHDNQQGVERGENIIFTSFLDDLRICHLGDLGHELDEETVSQIGLIDILFVPVGGTFTLDPKQAVRVAQSLDPSIVIPMHYKTALHNPDVFAALATVEDFVKAFGVEVQAQEKLEIEKAQLPESMELVVLQRT